MIYKIIFHPRVETELIESYSWYQEKKDGLGLLFYDLIEKKIIELAEHPERYPLVKNRFRQTIKKKVPFCNNL